MMRALFAPVRAWNRFWFAPTSARPLGAFRIVFGLVVLLNLSLLANDMDAWFTDAGYIRGTEAHELAGPNWSESVNVPKRWSPLQLDRRPSVVKLAFAFTAISAVLFTLGWRTKIASVGLYAGMLSIHHANIQTDSGADVLLMIMCFLMMLSPCGAAYSLDSRRKAIKLGGAYSALIAPWSQKLICLQVSIAYFVTGLLKAEGKTWADGTALHFILNNGEARRFTLGLTAYPSVLNAMTLWTVVFEFAVAFLLWFRAARPAMIAMGVMLHVGIWFTVNIPIFGELMMASYLCYLSADEWARVASVIDPRRWFARRKNASATIPGRVDRGHATAQGPHATTHESTPIEASASTRDSAC